MWLRVAAQVGRYGNVRHAQVGQWEGASDQSHGRAQVGHLMEVLSLCHGLVFRSLGELDGPISECGGLGSGSAGQGGVV